MSGMTVTVDDARGCRLAEDASFHLAGCALASPTQYPCMFNPAGYCYQHTSDGITVVLLSVHLYPGGLETASGWVKCPDFNGYATAKELPACP